MIQFTNGMFERFHFAGMYNNLCFDTIRFAYECDNRALWRKDKQGQIKSILTYKAWDN